MFYSKSQKGTCDDYKILIVAFSGLEAAYQDNIIFEFSGYLSKIASKFDRKFYVDPRKSWYQYGVPEISSNLDEFIQYLKRVIQPYEKIIFIGASAGGYASILFGSILNIDTVIAFVPQTLLIDEVCKSCYASDYTEMHEYKDLKKVINDTTNYVFVCAENIEDINHLHGNIHCLRFDNCHNVNIEKIHWVDGILSKYRDDGLLDRIISPHLQ